MRRQAGSFRHRFDIWLELTRKYFKMRYKGTALGYVWALLHPLLLTTVFYFVFGQIKAFRTEHFALFLASGIFLWNTFTNAVKGGATIYTGNSGLLKKVAFPRWLLPLAMISCDIIHLILTIPVLIVLMGILGVPIHPLAIIVGVPVVIAIQLPLCIGAALFCGTLTPYFRDLNRFIEVTVRFTFYLTPIIYPPTLYGIYRPLLYFHPAGCQVVGFRALFVDGTILWDHLGAALAGSVVICCLGIMVYRRHIGRIVEVL